MERHAESKSEVTRLQNELLVARETYEKRLLKASEDREATRIERQRIEDNLRNQVRELGDR